VFDRNTVSLDLTGPDPILNAFDGNARNMMKRFERDGATVEQATSMEDFERFVEIYQKTMRRVSADTFYYFDTEHFGRLRRFTLASAMLLVVKLGERIAAGALFLIGADWMHYHLSATDPEISVPGATNALISHAAQQGRHRGFKRLHLGGGHSDAVDDKLFRFKRRMSTDEHTFWIGKYVHNKEKYADVCGRWRDEHQDMVVDYGNRVLCYRFVAPATNVVDVASTPV
jgi:lipid II:glycine glycyltransferase (peptidoglycan interpeptide bridge formation enzyme)